jgi:hypothetical protein
LLKTYEIVLDIEKDLYNSSNILFTVSRNDFDSVELTFHIKQDDTNFDLTGTTVQLAIKKPSGLTVYQDCEITNALEGEAKIRLSNQSYIEYGIYTAEVYVRDADQLAVTSAFYYSSRSAIMEDETIESVNDWSALQMALFAYDIKPIITDGFPTETPEYIGQMAFDAINNIAYIANDLTSASWQAIGTGGGEGNDDILGTGTPAITPVRIGQIYIDTTAGTAFIATGATAADWEQIDNEAVVGGAVDWESITGKPTTFTPSAHTHTIADTTDLQSALDAKADDTDLAGKADLVHTHLWADITDKPITFTPSAHTHAIADVTGLQTALDGKADDADLTAKANVVDVYAKTETYNKTEVYNKDEVDAKTLQGGGMVVIDNLTSTSTTDALSANQGRILNTSKADLVHTHAIADVTNLQTTLDAKADDTDLAGKADLVHTHAIADVTNLQTTLDAKADDTDLATKSDVGHTHTSANITDFGTAVASAIPADYLTQTEGDALYQPIGADTAPAWGGITGTLANQTDLQTALDGKADDTDLAGKADLVHTHTSADISDFGTAVAGAIPADYLTQAEGDTLYEPIGAGTATAWGDVTGTLANQTDLQTALDTKVTNVKGITSIWEGTKAEFDAIVTKDPNTLYAVSDDSGAPLEFYTKTESDDRFYPKTGGIINGQLMIVETTGSNALFRANSVADDSSVSMVTTATAGYLKSVSYDQATVKPLSIIATKVDVQGDYIATVRNATVAPAIVPSYIGQIYVNNVSKIAYIACGITSADWKAIT